MVQNHTTSYTIRKLFGDNSTTFSHGPGTVYELFRIGHNDSFVNTILFTIQVSVLWYGLPHPLFLEDLLYNHFSVYLFWFTPPLSREVYLTLDLSSYPFGDRGSTERSFPCFYGGPLSILIPRQIDIK